MWLPSAWLLQTGAAIEAVDANRFAVVAATVGGETTRLTLTVDEQGRLTGLAYLRYGNQTADKRHAYIPQTPRGRAA